ncbi:hypothetical protein ABZ368_17920 [Streptomyces sp. NPDC005908]|uniref:hypothetical protein n=1 Tax=unclassified Streptomyces TaxID=2593676 RepID=UPI0033E93A99
MTGHGLGQYGRRGAAHPEVARAARHLRGRARRRIDEIEVVADRARTAGLTVDLSIEVDEGALSPAEG